MPVAPGAQLSDSAGWTDSDSRRQAIRDGLAAVRSRTLQLIAPLSADALQRQHSRLMSPIVWDLAHVAAFEELWLVRKLGSGAAESALEETYDALKTPRSKRGGLALPAAEAVRQRLAMVRERALALLAEVDLDSDDPLFRDGFAHELVRQHEAQHQETILQTILLMRGEPYVPAARRPLPGEGESARPGAMVRVPAGEFLVGALPEAFAYDNERPRQPLPVDAFEIGAFPVTNGEYLEFVAADGYGERSLWTDEGWAWKVAAAPVAPQYWCPAGEATCVLTAAEAAELARDEGLEGWRRVTSLGEEPVCASHPVIHVCAHEADAFARFSGARLPTEFEWEKAAAWDPDSGATHRYPWGETEPSDLHANLGQLGFGVVPIGLYPAGRSPVGCHQMLGDVWEWTSSPFKGYEGFRAFPYDEYSLVFFGDEYRVLRGASWGTAACVARNSFRNWDYPVRRQILAGFRLAREVG
ncbi:MAG: ergothioneine biosynthesis protein EgtB [Gemmatimonadota bacterium]